MKNSEKILQDALVKYNVLSASDLKKYIFNAQAAEGSLKSWLLKNEVVTEKQILIALSQKLNLETVDFKKVSVEPEVVNKVPIKIAWYYKIMPVHFKNNILTIASAWPLDVKIQDEIRMHLGAQVDVVLAMESQVIEALKKYYGLASDTLDRIMTKEPQKALPAQGDQWIEDLERKSEDPTISNLVNQIILEAYHKRATDIHIEPYRDKVRFRYRTDGVLVDANLPADVRHFIQPILSRIKILANLSITEKRLPQDGSAVVRTKEQNLDLRVSTMPTPRGESMVIRILPTKVMLFSLEKLGFDQTNVKIFRELIDMPHGIVFMTGPTGSGKTTTLYACLNEVNSSERKIITIEDPVEYEMEGITQVQVNPKVNFDFAKGLRSVLRHDPDIIMVGEVRDLETTEIAIRTALTGHLVFSTLHTNDAASGITRLVDMGVEPYLVASSVEAFVAQRLVRIICPKCKEEDQSPMMGVKEEIKSSLGLPNVDEIKLYRGRGCDHCNQTGFYGRIAVYEILRLNDPIRAAILEKPRSDYIKAIAVQEGLTTLRQSGWKAVLNGITTPGEVMNVTVKDEHTKSKLAVTETGNVSQEAGPKPKDVRVKIQKRDSWSGKNQYDSRSYPRAFEAIEIRYRLVKRDPQNPDFLISDGIEHSAYSEDISAGGLRFISKALLPMGSILELKIQLGLGDKSIVCLGKICRIEEDSLDNVYTIVAYYLDVSSADRVAISKFVKQKLKDEKKIESVS